MRWAASLVIVCACGGGSGAPAQDASIDAAPQTFCWTTWGTVPSSTEVNASCTLRPSPGFESVAIHYAGEHAFVQVGDNGSDYWTPGNPYINAVTGGSPPLSGLVGYATQPTGTQTLTFDRPVTGLVIAVVTMGDATTTVRYTFDHPIALLGEGAGHGGDGSLLVEGDSVLAGAEGHGVVQFADALTTLTWTIAGSEAGCSAVDCPVNHAFHGFTVGIPPQP
jgi:hypothetical protein